MKNIKEKQMNQRKEMRKDEDKNRGCKDKKTERRGKKEIKGKKGYIKRKERREKYGNIYGKGSEAK